MAVAASPVPNLLFVDRSSGLPVRVDPYDIVTASIAPLPPLETDPALPGTRFTLGSTGVNVVFRVVGDFTLVRAQVLAARTGRPLSARVDAAGAIVQKSVGIKTSARSAAGIFTVDLDNPITADKMALQATVESGGGYANAIQTDTDTITVHVFDATGAALDAPFTVEVKALE